MPSEDPSAPLRIELSPNALRFGLTCIRQFGRTGLHVDASDQEISDALTGLPERYRLYLELRFGLYDGLTRTYLEVARDAGLIEGIPPVSDQRARDLVLRAFAKLERSLRRSRTPPAA